MTILVLNRFKLENIDISYDIQKAIKLCEESVNFDLDCAKIIESLIEAYKKTSYTPEQQSGYLNLAKQSYAYLFLGEMASNSFIEIVTEESLRIYIDGCKQDANSKMHLKDLFISIAAIPEIDIEPLATLLYTLEINLIELQSQHAQQSDYEFIKSLIKLLDPYISNGPLSNTYSACKNFYCITPNKHKPTAWEINKESWGNLVKILTKISEKCKSIRTIMDDNTDLFTRNYTNQLDLPETLNIALRQQTMNLFADKPNCYFLTLDNYIKYHFHVFYEYTIFYKQLHDLLLNLKKEVEIKQILELEKLLLEAKSCILVEQTTNFKNRRDYIEQDNYDKMVSTQQYHQSLTSILQSTNINKKHLECLAKIFDNSKVSFELLKITIKALGGKLETFDGSKTRIILPGFYTTTISAPKIMGGFHKPHGKSKSLPDGDNIAFIHARLTAKALNRAGITKKDVYEELERREMLITSNLILKRDAKSEKHSKLKHS